MSLKSFQDVDEWCREHAVRVTEGRRTVAKIILASRDYPDVDELRRRIGAVNRRISPASVYRTLRLLVEMGLIERHTFQGSRARYGPALDEHQDHLIDVTSGRVLEFRSDEIERLQGEIARLFGYRLTGHRLELYGEPVQASKSHRSPIGARRKLRVHTELKTRRK